MAKRASRPRRSTTSNFEATGDLTIGTTPDDLLSSAMARGDTSFETGRYLLSFKEGAEVDGFKKLSSTKLRVASAMDFENQSVNLESIGDAQALILPEIGVAVVTSHAMQATGLTLESALESDSGIQVIEPEYFVFAQNSEFLRGFLSASKAIASELGGVAQVEDVPETEVLGATWGLVQCRVPASSRSGAGIKLAVLDTGFDMNHPDFTGRSITSATFVGQPVQDLNGHGTHCIGTACGPKFPPGTTPRYGIGYGTRIFAGKVLSNAGSGSGASVLAGMNWAISQRCEVISMSLGSASPVQSAYTNAGAAALRNGLLIVAAAGNEAGPTGAPANSPTIFAVASVDPNLTPSSFSSKGKIEIAAPGRDVFSSWPRPQTYRTISGTSMATPHVAGCAALWAQSNPSLRGAALWQRLQSSARRLPYPTTSVGAGLVVSPT